MTTWLDVIYRLGADSSAFWLSVAAWTLLVLPTLFLLDRWRAAHPFVQLRARQALLWALPLGLVAAAGVYALAAPGALGRVTGLTLAVPLSSAAPAPAVPALSAWHALGVLSVAALAGTVFGFARLVAQAFRLRRLRQRLQTGRPLPSPIVRAAMEAAGTRRPVCAVRSAQVAVPLAFGWRRPVAAVPEGLEGEDLRLTLVHELIHIRRSDVLWQGAEAVLAALFAAHPLVAHLARSVAACREQVVDADVLRRAAAHRRRYAELLCRFAAAPSGPRTLALPITTASLLTQRLEAMKTFPDSRLAPRRLGGLVALLLLALSVGTVAAPAALAQEDAAPPAQEVDEYPSLKGGLDALSQHVQYPELAKKAGVEGKVFVQFVVSTEGVPEDLRVAHFTTNNAAEDDAGLKAAALDAVRKARFTPGVKDGEPVRVQMTLPITFHIPEQAQGDSTDTSSLHEAPDGGVRITHNGERQAFADGLAEHIEQIEVNRTTGTLRIALKPNAPATVKASLEEQFAQSTLADELALVVH